MLEKLWDLLKAFKDQCFPCLETDLEKYEKELNNLSVQYAESVRNNVFTPEAIDAYHDFRRQVQALNLKYGVKE